MTDIIDRLERYAGDVCISTMTELAAAAEIKKLRAEIERLRAEIEAMKSQKPAAFALYSGWAIKAVYIKSEDAYDQRDRRQLSADLSGSLEAYRVVPLYLASGAQSDLNLKCKSVQKRLATQWGYVRSEDGNDE